MAFKPQKSSSFEFKSRLTFLFHFPNTFFFNTPKGTIKLLTKQRLQIANYITEKELFASPSAVSLSTPPHP